jgi:hypothetical protein
MQRVRQVRVAEGHTSSEACACGLRRAPGEAGLVREASGAEVRWADLLVNYLQVLGLLVSWSAYAPKPWS